MRTIDEEIHALPDDAIIRIGSKTAFFFIGTKEEYDRLIDGIGDDYYAKAEADIVRQNTSINNYLERDWNIQADESIMQYIDRVTYLSKQISNCHRQLLTDEDYIKTYKPIRARKILDFKESEFGDGYVFKLEGEEAGKYWTIKEWEEGYGKSE